MADKDSGGPFQRIEKLEQENEVLRERLEQAEEDIERLRRESEQLRQELKAAGRGSRRGRRKPKADPKRQGRKVGQGPFTFRQAPADTGRSSEPPIEVPVTVGQCPCCGGDFAGFRGGDGRAWLLTSVRNCCYDRLKQKGSQGQSTDFDEAVHSAGQQTSNPETLLILEERTGLLSESLAELPAEYREVLVLRELEQMSYREIANIAGIPLGTVMSRLSRARQRLQESLLATS